MVVRVGKVRLVKYKTSEIANVKSIQDMGFTAIKNQCDSSSGLTFILFAEKS